MAGVEETKENAGDPAPPTPLPPAGGNSPGPATTGGGNPPQPAVPPTPSPDPSESNPKGDASPRPTAEEQTGDASETEQEPEEDEIPSHPTVPAAYTEDLGVPMDFDRDAPGRAEPTEPTPPQRQPSTSRPRSPSRDDADEGHKARRKHKDKAKRSRRDGKEERTTEPAGHSTTGDRPPHTAPTADQRAGAASKGSSSHRREDRQQERRQSDRQQERRQSNRRDAPRRSPSRNPRNRHRSRSPERRRDRSRSRERRRDRSTSRSRRQDRSRSRERRRARSTSRSRRRDRSRSLERRRDRSASRSRRRDRSYSRGRSDSRSPSRRSRGYHSSPSRSASVRYMETRHPPSPDVPFDKGAEMRKLPPGERADMGAAWDEIHRKFGDQRLTASDHWTLARNLLRRQRQQELLDLRGEGANGPRHSSPERRDPLPTPVKTVIPKAKDLFTGTFPDTTLLDSGLFLRQIAPALQGRSVEDAYAQIMTVIRAGSLPHSSFSRRWQYCKEQGKTPTTIEGLKELWLAATKGSENPAATYGLNGVTPFNGDPPSELQPYLHYLGAFESAILEEVKDEAVLGQRGFRTSTAYNIRNRFLECCRYGLRLVSEGLGADQDTPLRDMLDRAEALARGKQPAERPEEYRQHMARQAHQDAPPLSAAPAVAPVTTDAPIRLEDINAMIRTALANQATGTAAPAPHRSFIFCKVCNRHGFEAKGHDKDDPAKCPWHRQYNNGDNIFKRLVDKTGFSRHQVNSMRVPEILQHLPDLQGKIPLPPPKSGN